MALTDKNLTVKEALHFLALNKIDWTEIWLRTQLGTGRIKSFKEKHMRLIPRVEIQRVIQEHQEKSA